MIYIHYTTEKIRKKIYSTLTLLSKITSSPLVNTNGIPQHSFKDYKQPGWNLSVPHVHLSIKKYIYIALRKYCVFSAKWVYSTGKLWYFDQWNEYSEYKKITKKFPPLLWFKCKVFISKVWDWGATSLGVHRRYCLNFFYKCRVLNTEIQVKARL